MCREEFYRNFAALYRQRDIGPYCELVRAGKMTIADCKRGKRMLDTLTKWERYIEKDPLLGQDKRHQTPLTPSLSTR